jgi:hydrogenase-4 transcriptional activator
MSRKNREIYWVAQICPCYMMEWCRKSLMRRIFFSRCVWREASQHFELDETIDRMAALLTPRLPADAVVVRGFDFQRGRIDTMAIGLCRPGPALPRSSSPCAPDEFSDVLAWCRHGAMLHSASGTNQRLLNLLAPQDIRGEWLAGPLVRNDQPIGTLLLLTRPPRTFEPQHHDIASAILEPIAIALGNNFHHHELARLREAVEAENRALLSRLDRESVTDTIVGSDAGLRPVMERIDQVAPTDAPVLILGETGSGKEVLARAIHSRSRRAAGPVVRVNCGALPPGLIDSELFGHERGSFTGALNVRKGWFERADGGTLFLDEIGELPLDAQVRLLRILQDGTFERIGAHKPLKVDVRIVAATHRDLQAMVAQGGFREDLWYRISVFPIHLPPLRERIEDIVPLAAHFANRAGKRLGGAPLSLSNEDIELLLSYPWPGNVRELATVIERAAILGNGRELRIAGALGTVTRRAGRMTPKDWVHRAAASAAVSDSQSLDAATKAHIVQALRATEGRIEGRSGAAVRLGVNPHTLRARMRKLGIDWSKFRRPQRRPSSGR